MNDLERLISLIFPNPLPTPEALEQKYPKRDLQAGAVVTRFAPSPTGFIHIGGIYISVIGKNLATNSGGVYFIRIEDTDQARKVDDSETQFDKTFKYFKIESQENDSTAPYGPYTQSERADLYLTYIKYLVGKKRAYPCFCTKEALDIATEKQREAKIDMGYYGEWATCSHLDEATAAKRIEAGEPYVIRFRCNGELKGIQFDDLIRKKVKARNNINDIVILKSSVNELPLPTYHLAHAVDDHLMRVNVVLRGDEWISSVPVHLQLFDALDFDRISYAHIAPLMKQEGKSKRKLSKRKDPEASVGFYMEKGFPADSVIIYLKGLANSALTEITTEEALTAAIKIEKMPKAGALIDMVKLSDVSSNHIATMSGIEIRDAVADWANEFDPTLADVMKQNWDHVPKVIDTDRFNNGKARKDLVKWSDFKSLYGFFFNDLFELSTNIADERFDGISKDVIQKLLQEFSTNYNAGFDSTEWFEFLKTTSGNSGFALNNKMFKEDPDKYHGTLREVTKIIRIAISGKEKGPSLHEVCETLGKDEINRRFAPLLAIA